MKFKNNSAIYRNDNLIFENGDSVKGKAKEVKEYLLYELASQCMSINQDYEEIVYNGRLILDLIEELENNGVHESVIIVKENPMGSLYYEIIENNEVQ